jgi:hypothetical protein
LDIESSRRRCVCNRQKKKTTVLRLFDMDDDVSDEEFRVIFEFLQQPIANLVALSLCQLDLEQFAVSLPPF